jgi:EAL domain-containing protein (putative c-di-GMP-specific phosphodiesterase class I)
LKIDIEFVRDLTTNQANQHLVKAIVGLARDFGYETIAEGVEDSETLFLLKDCGVDYAQGFLLGRPAPIEAC